MTPLLIALLLILPPGAPPVQVRVVAYAELPGDRFPVEGKLDAGILVYVGQGELIFSNRTVLDFRNGESQIGIPSWIPDDAVIILALWERTRYVNLSWVPVPAEGTSLMGLAQRTAAQARKWGIGVLLHGRFPHWDGERGLLRGYVPEEFWGNVLRNSAITPLLGPILEWALNRSMIVTVAPSVLTPQGFMAPRDCWVMAYPAFVWTTFVTPDGVYESLGGRIHLHVEGNETWVRVIRGDLEENLTIRVLDPSGLSVIKVNSTDGPLYVLNYSTIPAFGVNLSSYPQLVDYNSSFEALFPTGLSVGNESATISLLGAVELLGADFPSEGRGPTVVVVASFRSSPPLLRGPNAVNVSTPFGNLTGGWTPVRASDHLKAELVEMAESGLWLLVDPVWEPLNVTLEEGVLRITLSPEVPDAEGTLSIMGEGWSGTLRISAGEAVEVPFSGMALVSFSGDSFVYMPQELLVVESENQQVRWGYDVLPPILALAVLLALVRRYWGWLGGLSR